MTNTQGQINGINALEGGSYLARLPRSIRAGATRLLRMHWTILALAALLFGGSQAALAQQASPSLYDRLGGLAPISVVVNDFIDALVVDDVLNANPAIDAARQHVPAPYLKYHVTALVCQATGGPCSYHGREMKPSHAHLNITEPEWQRMVVLFNEVLAKYQVPEQETQELLAIIDSTKADIVVAPQ